MKQGKINIGFEEDIRRFCFPVFRWIALIFQQILSQRIFRENRQTEFNSHGQTQFNSQGKT
jgi:hypothetical protein